jgi:hypothetical protein
MSTLPYDTADYWTDPDYAVTPAPVTPAPVTPGVTPAVTPAVTPVASPAVTQAGNGGDGGEGNGDLGWLGTSEWVTEPGEEAARDARPAPGLRLRRNLGALAGSEAVGGGPGGLLAEPAAPRPESMRQHWRHVTTHPALEEIGAPWALWAFVAGHLAVTAPAKATGKALVIAGEALVFAGTRIDWAGDRFARIFTALAITGVLAIIILIFG